MNKACYSTDEEDPLLKIQLEFQKQILSVCKMQFQGFSNKVKDILQMQKISSESVKEKFKGVDNYELTQIIPIVKSYNSSYQAQKRLIEESQKMQSEFEISSSPEDILSQQISTLKKEIEDIEKQIEKQIKYFKQYLVDYLLEKNKIIDSKYINLLLEKLNLEKGIQNESYSIDQILEVFDLTRKQEKEIKVELQIYSEEILKRKNSIQQKNEKLKLLNESLQNQSSKIDDPLFNSLIQSINKIAEKDLNLNHKDNLRKMINYIKEKVQDYEEISEKEILKMIENMDLSRQKEKKIIIEIKQFIEKNKYEIQKEFYTEDTFDTISRKIDLVNELNLSFTKSYSDFTSLKKYSQQLRNGSELKEISHVSKEIKLDSYQSIQDKGSQLKEIKLSSKVSTIFNSLVNQINQITGKDWISSHKQNLKELINYLKKRIENSQSIYEKDILDIIESVGLSKQTEKKLIVLINNYISENKSKIYHEHLLKSNSVPSKQPLKKQNYLESQIFEDNLIQIKEKEKKNILKYDKTLSKIYTLVYQQQDHCLDLASLKVICDFQTIQELIGQLKQNNVKTVALYGDFMLSIKIIQKYYPNSAQQLNLYSYKRPNYDRIIAITDEQIVFLILEEQEQAFEGDIFQNEESYLYIRFLLDCCSIFVTCLNEKQINKWSNNNPFEQFEAIVPPKEFKDKSSIFLKQIKINSNLLQRSKILLSNDQNSCIIMHEHQLSRIIDDNQLYVQSMQINQNRDYINQIFNSQDLYSFVPQEKINDKKYMIDKIFNKHTDLLKEIDGIYSNLKISINKSQQSLQEQIFIQELLCLNKDQPVESKPMKQEKDLINDAEIQRIQKENKYPQLIINNNQKRNSSSESEQKPNNSYKQNDYNLFNLINTLKDQLCLHSFEGNQYQVIRSCKNCLTFKSMVEQIHQKIEKERSLIIKYYYTFQELNLNEIIQNIQYEAISQKISINFSRFSKYLNRSHFYSHFKLILTEVINNLYIYFENYSLQKSALDIILDFILSATYELLKVIVLKRQKVNEEILRQKDEFLNNIDLCFQKLQALKEERICFQPLQFTYNPAKKEEVLLSMNFRIQNINLNDQAHRLVDYISFDAQADYLVFNNCNQKDKNKQKTFIYILRKKKAIPELEYTFSVANSLDISIFINQYSRQWVIFANDTQKNSLGKINSDYTFEEGRIDTNVYTQRTSNGNLIERVDSCIILNEKTNVIILYEKKKKQFYELFLSGLLKEIRFDLIKEVAIKGSIQNQNINSENYGEIQSVKNSSEGDFYVFQTDKFLLLTNPNYIVKQEIPLKENFQNFKLITTDSSTLLVTLHGQNEYECYLVMGIADPDDLNQNLSKLACQKTKIGNIVIDKIIQSLVHYGSNYTQIGCPAQVHQIFYYEKQRYESNTQNFDKCIQKYFKDCLLCKNISFNITQSQENCFSEIDLLLNKLDLLLLEVNPISSSDLQFILQTRIPIQLTTIQQTNYLPLKDGLFKQDLMNVPEVEDQIEQIKKQISFGWIENMVQLYKKEIYLVSMCGRQSVGKSSQLNRMFGTRFGVSASRCTDGIWVGLSKIEDKLILVMDCEGLFSIRRNEDEEVKLLLQITSISHITMIFCDIDGINQPLLSLFKKLQICAGKMQSDSYFLGTMVLLTKNVQDEGDRHELLQESQIHLNKKEIKNTISKIFKGGLSYGFLKSYLSKDYDLYLQKIYLNDDQDIDLISKQSEIKEEYDKFVELFFDISQQNFISNDKLLIQFQYHPTLDSEKELIKLKSIFKHHYYFKQSAQKQQGKQFQDQIQVVLTNQDIVNAIHESCFSTQTDNNENNCKVANLHSIFDQSQKKVQVQSENKNERTEFISERLPQNEDYQKSFEILEISQSDIKLFPQQTYDFIYDRKSQNCEDLENIFFSCFRILQRANFNNYVQQMQNFYNLFIKQRKNTIKKYFYNRLPKESKYRDIVDKYKSKFEEVVQSLDKQFVICKQKCNKCNRFCVNLQGHKGNCNCETSHKCYQKCQICKNENECFLISGHEGTHFCKEMNHLCQKSCQMSVTCKELCTLEPHSDEVKHSCQREHKCDHQCRLHDKCGKTCSLQSGHEEKNHICDSTQCYDKCEFCDKLCGFNCHDHDILLSNIEKNKDLLMKDGKLISKHLCGDYHRCQKQCQMPGVCSITYKPEEKIWETKTSKFEYQFFKPCKIVKKCDLKIQPWQTSHEGQHQCSSTHRCDQQCPECLSYCFENYNHPGNHKSKNHRNKENCVFVSESDEIKIYSGQGNTRSYLPGESSTPENCYQSCVRMGRAHVHLRQCKGGDECAEKKYSFARHSTKKYKPFTHLVYDEMLCKGYWNSINWESPVEEENLQIIQSCNVGCSHESHENNPNYCVKQAWHEGNHQIDHKKCEHIGSDIVDICFTIDTTGSMQWAMVQVAETVKGILQKFEGKTDIKYSIVSYRDHPPEDKTYVYNIDSQLTDKDQILNVLQGMKADGGGDSPEAVMDGLYHSAASINWRNNSQRFIFHIADSPPHGKQFGSTSNNPQWKEKGCPCGIKEQKIAQELMAKKIFYYLIKVNSTLNMMEDIFQREFDSFYKQTIDLTDVNKLNIEIISVLSKEIVTTNEFYHVKQKKQVNKIL